MSSDSHLEPISPRERLIEFWVTLQVLTPRVFVTHLLIAANVIVFALMVLREPQALTTPSGNTLIDFGANFGPRTLDQEPWRLFTSMFVHIGILHIGMNMWSLWNIGRLMERVLGNVGFLLLYVISGLCGSLASVAYNPYVLSAGASGAIFGVLGGMLGFLVFGRGSMPTEVVNELRSSGTAFVGYNLLFGFIVRGIDNSAHLGGLLSGCLCGLILGQQLTLERPIYRWPRNLIVLLVGSATVWGGLAVLPAPVDVANILQNAGKLDDQLVKRYEELRSEVNSDKLTTNQFAAAIEEELLPLVRSTREQIASSSRPPAHLRPLLNAYEGYLQEREKLLEMQISALRDSDRNAQDELERQHQALENSLIEFNRVAEETAKANK